MLTASVLFVGEAEWGVSVCVCVLVEVASGRVLLTASVLHVAGGGDRGSEFRQNQRPGNDCTGPHLPQVKPDIR